MTVCFWTMWWTWCTRLSTAQRPVIRAITPISWSGKKNYNKMMKDYNAQQKEIARLQRIVDRFKNKPTKGVHGAFKEKAIEHMVKLEAPDRFDTRTFHANFQPDKETGNDVLLVTNLAIGYDHPLSTVSFDLKKRGKAGNPRWKWSGEIDTFKTLVGQLAPLAGEYNFGTNVQIGYFDQQMAMYSSRKTVLDDFWDEFPNLTETEARNALGAFMFTGEDVFKNIDMLSGGEKVRLALCKILKRRPNVLVLDEPTNHMDIVGKETLESMLKDFSGTLIFVSHDRYFVRKVANRLLVFEDGTTHLYQFGYEEYQEKLDREAAESGDDYRKNPAALGGAISQNGAGQQSKGTQETGGKKAYYNPGKERSKIEKKSEEGRGRAGSQRGEAGRFKTGTAAAGISVQLFQADRDSGRNRCAGGRNHGGYGKLGGTFPAA